MPPKGSLRITIIGGEECALVGNCRVDVALVSGVVEIAGVVLKPRKNYVFHLETDLRQLVMYSLEGGQVNINCGDAPLTTVKGTACSEPVIRLCRRKLATLPRSVVAVVGRSKKGTTLTAHTICNSLAEVAAENSAQESQHVTLVDLNPESNCIYAPGCVSCVVASPGQPVLWPGSTASPMRLPIAFPCGDAARPSMTSMPSLLHSTEQVMACASAFESEFRSANRTSNNLSFHVVVDVPPPDSATLNEGMYYRRMIETLRPTHVVVVGDKDTDEFGKFLEEDIQRLLPDCEFVFVPGVSSECSASTRVQRLTTYFAGTPEVPLGCARVVLPLGKLNFHRLVVSKGDGSIKQEKVRPTEELNGTVCSLSHAELDVEVPFAPLAGMLLIEEVDEVHEELVLVVPAGAGAFPRRHIILPPSPHGIATLSDIREIQQAVVL